MSLSSLVDSLNEAINSKSSSEELGPRERESVISICSKLLHAVESPPETVFRMMMAVRQFVRIARVLTASGILEEVGVQRYKITPAAKLLVEASPIGHIFSFLFDEHLPFLAKMPQYLTQTGFQNPSSLTDGPFQYAYGTKLTFFEWLENHPDRYSNFNSAMTAQRMGRLDRDHWFNYFPLKTLLENFTISIQGSSDAVLLVDIGGGVGHDLIALSSKYPHLPGRLVLQDLPKVVQNIGNLPAGIESKGHDFFTSQPIKGACIYYMHTVLHDWPDAEAVKILANIVPAMGPDSRLLLNEIVFGEVETPLFPAQLDLSMMGAFGSKERTSKQWSKLLGSVDLEIIKIYKPEGASWGGECLIEARKQS
ncbi:hypothetical protein MMC25_006492 [Agyrium rufum]|nr:hypothetical protein [Agyrium rufum]